MALFVLTHSLSFSILFINKEKMKIEAFYSFTIFWEPATDTSNTYWLISAKHIAHYSFISVCAHHIFKISENEIQISDL